MANFIAVYDACVFYPAQVRDLLMRVALTDLFKARWTEQIHDEWTRNLQKNRPDIDPARIQRTRELINASVPDCLVRNYASLIPELELPDPDDRHVLAAVIRCHAGVIMTYNVTDRRPCHAPATQKSTANGERTFGKLAQIAQSMRFIENDQMPVDLRDFLMAFAGKFIADDNDAFTREYAVTAAS